MSKELTALEINVETGIVVERFLTAEEISEREVMALEYAQRESEADAKVDARQSALAKLAALGLTQEEIEAL